MDGFRIAYWPSSREAALAALHGSVVSLMAAMSGMSWYQLLSAIGADECLLIKLKSVLSLDIKESFIICNQPRTRLP
jgi:hypothetical protein